MPPALAEAIVGAIGFVGVVGLTVRYLMTMPPAPQPDHEYLSARQQLMKGKQNDLTCD